MLEAPTMYRDGDPANEIFDRLRAAFHSFLRMTPDCRFEGEIARETRLRDIGDSIAVLGFIMEIEAEFGIEIDDDDDIDEFDTVGDIERFLDPAVSR